VSSHIYEYILFTLYCLLGPAMWLAIGFALYKGRKRMLLIRRPALDLPDPPPKVTILIPAKDEGSRIRACIESALAQDYPDFEVIAINDRSTDNTGAVLNDLAEKKGISTLKKGISTFYRVIHIKDGELREGWTGKHNALHTAVSHARGEWYLFVDSDVILQPDALRTALAFSAAKNIALFSLFPKLESHSLWESLTVPLAGTAVSILYRVAMTNNDHWPSSFANGQFLLFNADAYNAIGGHAAVKNRFCEDVEFARLVKPTKRRVRITWGADFAAVRMYDSLPSIIKGWARIFYACSLGRPWRILLGITCVVASCFSVYPALIWGIYRLFHPVPPSAIDGWLLASFLHLFAMTVFLSVIYHWSGNPKRNALLFPLGGTLLLGIFAKALRMCATNQLVWRGTRYGNPVE
jgi:cellulose synthase/poly-beta-1,6-N-acetylglucosamine synthase-like glycosyltransferase